MIEQVKSIQSKIELLVEEFVVLSRLVAGIEAKKDACEELQKQVNKKSFDIGVKEKNLKEKAGKFEEEKVLVQKKFNSFVMERKQLDLKGSELKKEKEEVEKLKRWLAKREIKVIDMEEEREELDLNKKTFEVVRAKVEKERQISRDRNEALDERERKMKVKEELLRKRLQG